MHGSFIRQTVGASSSENVNQVRFAQNRVRGDILDRSTGNRVRKHQDNNVGVVAVSMRQRQIRKMFPMWKDRTYCEVKGL